MVKKNKEEVQVWSAIGMLIAGTSLAIAGFIVTPLGEIHDSVLWFFAQCLVYAGSIFGITVYVTGKIKSIEERLRGSLNKGEEESHE